MAASILRLASIAGDEERSLFFITGVWTPWHGVGRVKDGPQDFESFLTTNPNALIKPIHEKAMPVIMPTPEEADVWMNTPWSEAKGPRKPAADNAPIIVDKPA